MKNKEQKLVFQHKLLTINILHIILRKIAIKLFFYLVQEVFFLLLRRVSATRSVPVEPPQGRKAARVNSRSGAM